MKSIILVGTVIIFSVLMTGCFGAKISKVEAKEIFVDYFPQEEADIEIVDSDLKIILKNKIFFSINQSELREGAEKSLKKVVSVYTDDILHSYPDSTIVIEGYADSDGSQEYNLKLSQERAESVVEYFSSNTMETFISKDKMKAIGYGEANPRVPNTSAENKAINRRVEIIFKGMYN